MHILTRPSLVYRWGLWVVTFLREMRTCLVSGRRAFTCPAAAPEGPPPQIWSFWGRSRPLCRRSSGGRRSEPRTSSAGSPPGQTHTTTTRRQRTEEHQSFTDPCFHSSAGLSEISHEPKKKNHNMPNSDLKNQTKTQRSIPWITANDKLKTMQKYSSCSLDM